MSKPSVMIDGFNLGLEKGTGVATYARNLSYRLGELGHPVDVVYGSKSRVGKNRLLAEIGFFDPGGWRLTPWRVIKGLANSPFGIEARQVPITGTIVSKTFRSRLPHYDRIFNSRDLFTYSRYHFKTYGSFAPLTYERPATIGHWTYPVTVELKGAANLYTIHDLVPLRLPYTTLDNKKHYYQVIRRICEKADHIVTVSEASKRDIIDLFGVSEDRVTNTYQSATLPEKLTSRSEDEVADEIEAIFNLDFKKYFLFYGAIEPKKNVGRIIEAYLSSQSNLPLVVVGSVTWKDQDDLRLLPVAARKAKESKTKRTRVGRGRDLGAGIARKTAGVGKGGKIIRLEYLPLSLLVSLIRGARSVVFPSLYEGFGLPILEAMQLGTAVITGTEGSNPEIAGDAGLLVDPYDTAAIAKAIQAMGSDTDLVARHVAAGRERAKMFSPDAYRGRLDALYARYS